MASSFIDETVERSSEALTGLLSGLRPLPDTGFQKIDGWYRCSTGCCDADDIAPLWSDATDIDLAMRLGTCLADTKIMGGVALYIIAADDGFTKVGVSSNLGQRLSDLQRARRCGAHVHAALWVPSGALAIEREVHQRIVRAGFALKNEWTDMSPDDAMRVALEVAESLSCCPTPARALVRGFAEWAINQTLRGQRKSRDVAVSEFANEEISQFMPGWLETARRKR